MLANISYLHVFAKRGTLARLIEPIAKESPFWVIKEQKKLAWCATNHQKNLKAVRFWLRVSNIYIILLPFLKRKGAEGAEKQGKGEKILCFLIISDLVTCQGLR